MPRMMLLKCFGVFALMLALINSADAQRLATAVVPSDGSVNFVELVQESNALKLRSYEREDESFSMIDERLVATSSADTANIYVISTHFNQIGDYLLMTVDTQLGERELWAAEIFRGSMAEPQLLATVVGDDAWLPVFKVIPMGGDYRIVMASQHNIYQYYWNINTLNLISETYFEPIITQIFPLNQQVIFVIDDQQRLNRFDLDRQHIARISTLNDSYDRLVYDPDQRKLYLENNFDREDITNSPSGYGVIDLRIYP